MSIHTSQTYFNFKNMLRSTNQPGHNLIPSETELATSAPFSPSPFTCNPVINMKSKLLVIPLAILSLAAFIGSTHAGSATYNLNTDPEGFIDRFGNSVWRPTGGVGGTGYLSITDAVNGQGGVIVFDDLDPGSIVTAFTFSCDVRVGGGTADPADGFSVNFTRAGDPALTNSGGGFPLAQEEGSGTGISVCFDEWDSGTQEGVADVVGVSVRVDGVRLTNFAMPTRNGSATDATSLQTGPQARAVDGGTFDVADHTFAPLLVKLDSDGTLDVTYKGAAILTNFASGYFPSAGRLLFAGRTGGANSHHHIDNIVINTTASANPLVTAANLSALSLTAQVTDSATVALDATKPVIVKIDGVTVAATVSKTDLVTTLTYSASVPNFYAAGAHIISVQAKDLSNNTFTITRNATVAPYALLNTAWKAAPGQVNLSNKGFNVRTHQMSAARSNNLPAPEKQFGNGLYNFTISGVYANMAEVGPQPGGGFINPGPLNWDQAAAGFGNFTAANLEPETLIPGIPSGDPNNITSEVVAWIDLPAGITRVGISSDDGFTFSVGANPRDFFGRTVAGQFNGGRGADLPGTQFDVAVPTAGLYPVRILWWEGEGGANLELFTVDASGGKHLVNSTQADPDSRSAYFGALNASAAISEIGPYPSATDLVFNQHPLIIRLVDGIQAVNDATIALTIDGVLNTTRTIANDGIYTTITQPAPVGGWTGGLHNVSLAYNSGSPVVSRTQAWSFKVVGGNTTFVWKGGGGNDITNAVNWVGDVAPFNDGKDLTIFDGDKITFNAGGLLIPNEGDRQINVRDNAQILFNVGTNDTRIEARVNVQGDGTDGTGGIYINNVGWGKPQNLFLTADTTVTATGQRFRMDGGPNRLDLNGKTLTFVGNNEVNLVGTNAYGTSGVIATSITTAFEGGTRLDPNIIVRTGPNVNVTSWGGQNSRREAKFELGNNSRIESRQGDRDLTYTNDVSVAAGNTATLRGNIQANGQPGDGTDMRLNIMGKLTGAGAFRADGNGTLILAGANDYLGGTTLAQATTGIVLAASNNAFGPGNVTVSTPSTVQLSNAGGLESRDGAARDTPVDAGVGSLNPALTGLHSTQGYDNTRFAYTGKIRNTTASPLLMTFAEQYDDDVYLTIDGETSLPVLNNTAWDTVSTGQVTLAPGEHDIFVTVRNGGGGAGPNNGNNNAFPGWNTKGVAYSTTQPVGAASTASADYTKLGDNFEVYQGINRTYANGYVLNSPLTLSTARMNGYDATITGPISGPSELTVLGATDSNTDELILSGTGSYSGATTINDGTLIVNGNFSTATGLVSVNAGSTLGGTGTLGGATVVGGQIAPGSGGIGTLTVAANTTWNAGSSWSYQLGAGNTSDRLAITGDFTKGVGTGYAFNFSNTGGAGTYTLVTWTGITSFAAGDFSSSNLAAGTTGTFAIVGKSLVLNASTAGGGGGYAAWSATAFAAGTSAADRLAAADPDKDGVANLLEYALNTNPSMASSTPAPEIVTVGVNKFLQVRWTRPNNRTDITTIGEVSTNLTPLLDWVTGPTNVTTTITPAGAGLEEVIIRDVKAVGVGPRRFIRAKVTL